MSVTGTRSVKRYVGNGTDGPFAIDFEVTRDDYGNAEYITVLRLNTVTEQVDDITAVCSINGLNVTTDQTYSSDYLIILKRDVPITQVDDFQYGNFSAASLNRALDKLTMVAQQVSNVSDGALRIAPEDAEYEPDDVTPIGLTLPMRDARAGKTLIFDDNGSVKAGVPVSAVVANAIVRQALSHAGLADFFSELGFSLFVQSILADADASALLASLGFSPYVETLIGTADVGAMRTALDVYRKSDVYTKTESNNMLGSQFFDNDGTFTVPANVKRVKVTLCGSGGNSGGATVNYSAGSAGGGGAYIVAIVSVTPSSTVSVVTGQGKDSSFGTFVTATKGANGTTNISNNLDLQCGANGVGTVGTGAIKIFGFNGWPNKRFIRNTSSHTYHGVGFYGTAKYRNPDTGVDYFVDEGGGWSYFGTTHNGRSGASNTASRAGVLPGEGASGCYRVNSSQSAGLGKGGFVLVEWGGV